MLDLTYKGIILIGGPQKGTRFRPLSLDCPKPLFPVAGFPTIQHHIEKLSQIGTMKEVLLIGFYQATDRITDFVNDMQRLFGLHIRYLQEFTPLGTAGGIYHFRDQILVGNTDAFFVINADVCGDFPLAEMAQAKRSNNRAVCLMLTNEATREQSLLYGCAVVNKETNEVLHFVEKPTTFVSTTINCGVYMLTPDIFTMLADIFHKKSLSDWNDTEHLETPETIWFERHIFPALVSSGTMFAFHTTRWWSQLKSPSAAIYTNRHYLTLYHQNHPDRLAKPNQSIIDDVYVHPTARIHESALIGPNVSIGKNVIIGEGVRVKESIILDGATLQDHSCVMHSIIGWNSTVGMWSRIEGTPAGPNPNMPFAKLESKPLFNRDGRLNPSITILGCNVQVPAEVMIMNSIVLPHKELGGSYKNQIIL